jgi:uncharacterized protein
MAKDFDAMEDSNRSGNPTIHEIIQLNRRMLLRGATAISLAPLLAPMAGCAASAGSAPRLGFKGIAVGLGDKLVVPEGYVTSVIAAWGEPIGVVGNMPAFKIDGSNSAADQAVQMGMHHDGIEYFPIDGSSKNGVIALNHEYTDDGLLHPDGFTTMTAEKVKKSQNAHGLAVYEVAMSASGWQMVRPSRFARRFTMDTPFSVSGPAAGHAMMKTTADPAGQTILGTLNN